MCVRWSVCWHMMREAAFWLLLRHSRPTGHIIGFVNQKSLVEIDCVCSQEIHQIHFSASSARKRALAWRHARRMTKMDVFLYKWCAAQLRNPCARLTLLQPRGAHNNELSANFFAHFHGNNNRFTFPPGMCVGASFIYNFFPACRRRTK